MLKVIFFTVYYLVWFLCFICVSAFLSENYYLFGAMLLPFVGFTTIIFTVLSLLVLIILFHCYNKFRTNYTKYLKLIIYPIIGSVPYIFFYFSPKELDDNKSSILVTNINYACECANWRLVKINNKLNLKEEDIYLEPFDKSKIIPDSVKYGSEIQLYGNFYLKKSFPKNYYSNQNPDKARVFRYSDFKIVNYGFL